MRYGRCNLEGSDVTGIPTRVQHALVCGGVAALAVAAIDVTVGFIADDARFRSVPVAVTAHAATAALTLLVFLLLRVTLGPLLAARGARDGEALSVAMAVGVTSMLASLDAASLPAGVGGLFELGVDAALGIVAAAGAYPLAIAARAPAGPSAAARLARSLPFLMPLAAFAAWVLFVRVDDVTSVRFIVGLLTTLVVAMGLARLASLPARSSWEKMTLTVLAAVLATGVVGATVILRGPAVGITGHRTTGPVSRVILLSVDTLRRDSLSCYGSTTVQTPNIDRLAQDGCLFRNATASSPWTLPSFASILSGMPARVHGALTSTTSLPDTVTTLAEHFRSAGYRTMALVANGMLAPHRGVAQGFQDYELSITPVAPVSLGEMLASRLKPRLITVENSTADITEAAINFVNSHRNDSWFLWVHYLDPHLPYTPPEQHVLRMNVHQELGLRLDIESATRPSMDLFGDASRRVWARSLYDAEVRNVDAHIGRFLGVLRDSGIYDDALIVFAVDHGEEFWDHDGFEHGHTLYNELVAVPLIVKAPGAKDGRVVEDAVAIYDVAPTVLELCGLPASAGPGAVSLVPALRGDALAGGRSLYTGATLFRSNLEGVVFDGWKYIRSATTGREELFDLGEDPAERNSHVNTRPDMLERGRRLLEENIRSAEEYRRMHGIENRAIKLDPAEIERLRALGYL